MSPTAIEWTEETWNPTTGCDRVSPGCDNCYALTQAKRLKAMGQARYQRDGDPRTSGPGFGLTEHDDALEKPLGWKRPRRVFVNSMSDLFHPSVSARFIEDVFKVMERAGQHTFQILTKRPQRMADIVPALLPRLRCLPNVWLGTSIESKQYRFRARALLETHAAVQWLSIEPLIAPLGDRVEILAMLQDIDWVVVGGESGPKARPMHPQWVRDVRDACQFLEIPFFFKQWGGRTPKAGGRELDGREWSEYPA